MANRIFLTPLLKERPKKTEKETEFIKIREDNDESLYCHFANGIVRRVVRR